MTFTIQSENIGEFNIYIEQEKFESNFKVGIVKEQSPGLYGFPISELRYETLNKAKRRYQYLKRKALRGEY